jgi:hypothetical protein
MPSWVAPCRHLEGDRTQVAPVGVERLQRAPVSTAVGGVRVVAGIRVFEPLYARGLPDDLDRAETRFEPLLIGGELVLEPVRPDSLHQRMCPDRGQLDEEIADRGASFGEGLGLPKLGRYERGEVRFEGFCGISVS